jgi:hypothetical protein
MPFREVAPMKKALLVLVAAASLIGVALWLGQANQSRVSVARGADELEVTTQPGASSTSATQAARHVHDAGLGAPAAAHAPVSPLQRLERGEQLVGAAEKPPASAGSYVSIAAPSNAASAERQALETLPPNERKAIEMYDLMAQAFARDSGPCPAMIAEINSIIDRHESAVRAMTSQWASAGPQAAEASRARVESALGPRLENIRQAMRNAMARCSSEPGLMDALRRLAEMQPATTP